MNVLKSLLVFPLLLVTGCGTMIPSLGGMVPGVGGEPRLLWSGACEATVIQPVGGSGLASTFRLKDADAACPALKRPAVAASAPGA